VELHWLREHVEALPRHDRWQTLARAALRDDLYGLQAEFTAEVLRGAPGETEAHERIEAWVEGNRAAIERSLQVLRDVNASGISTSRRSPSRCESYATLPTPHKRRASKRRLPPAETVVHDGERKAKLLTVKQLSVACGAPRTRGGGPGRRELCDGRARPALA
jgi:hypothetical protein